MSKHKRTILAFFERTLWQTCKRGFVVFGLFAVMLPLFFLTRVNTHVPHAHAATNDTLNFQARLQTSSGAIAPDGYYNVQFKLYDASSGGTLLWTGTYYDSNGVTAGNDNRTRVANGYLTVNLGDIDTFPSTIPWDQQLYVTMNIGDTTQTATPTWDGEMNPRLKLTAVPYAFNAKTASELTKSSGANIATLSILAPTSGNQTFQIQDQGAAGTYNILTAPSGSDGYIKLQGLTPGTQQTGNFNISGTGIASVLQAGTLDASSATALAIGTTNATAINLNQNTTIASGKSLTVTAGASSFTGLGSGTSTAVSVATGATSNVGITISAVASQTADLLQLRDSSGNVNSAFNAAGNQLTLGRIAGSGTVTQGTIVISDGTTSGFGATVQSSTLTADRKFLLPDTALATTASPGTICVFNGASSNCPAATGSTAYIWNSNTVQAASNFYTRSANTTYVGGVIEGANGQTADLLNLNTYNGTTSTTVAKFTAAGNLQVAGSLDTTTATTLTIGGTNATAINLNQSTVLAANKSITITGGNTASRPGSPTEGMVYFDTTTKQLLTYANGKWQGDRTTATKIVAASNSSQTLKDAADYVADGTGDQNEINAALTAAAGGTVYLAEGTYSVNATISIPNNTTLVGAGKGTLIQLADLDATDNLIENGDQAGTATGIVIRDLSLDGNKAANTGAITQNGIYFVGGVGDAATRDGATLQNLWISNFETNGIEFHEATANTKVIGVTSSNNDDGGLYVASDGGSINSTITGSHFQNNGTDGLRLAGWYNWSITNNVASGNTGRGFYIASSNTTVTGNTASNNGNSGFDIYNSNNTTITGNTTNGNIYSGIELNSSDNNTVSGNIVTDNGNSTDNNGISLIASDNNTITGNTITDTSHVTTNFAINITDSASDTNYFADNTLNGSSISDSGTGTIYGGQIDGSGYIQFKGMAGANIQGTTTINTTGTAATSIGNTTGTLALQGGVSSSFSATNATGTTKLGFTAPSTAGIVTFNLPAGGTGGSTYDICTTLTVCSGYQAAGSYLTASLSDNIADALDIQEGTNNYINIATSNGSENISFGNVTTNPSYSFLGAGTTTYSGSIEVAGNQSVRITGGNTASRPGSPTEGMVYFDTTTKQLLTYANGKWQGDRTTATKIVAASNSSQTLKDAADYVADGTGDQNEINAALTAAAGGTVYLAEGTYSVNATISIPNNTTLVGAGMGTLIQLADIDATDNLIENSDTTTGTGITIRDLKLDGQQSLQTGTITQYGVYLYHMGNQAAGRVGARISNVYVSDVRDAGIYFDASENNVVTNSTLYSIDAGGTAPVGIYNDSSSNNSFTNNTFLANYWGLRLDGSGTRNTTVTGNIFRGSTNKALFQFGATHSTITGNTFDSNTDALILYTSGDSAVSGNTFYANTGYGITLDDSSSNTITSNRIQNSGDTTDNNAIYILNNSDSNTITDNTITDSSAVTTNYAIRIASGGSDTNYLSSNSLGGGTINDSGTGTVYGGQSQAANGDFLFRGANSATAFRLQNANGTSTYLNVDSSTNAVTLANGTINLNASSNFATNINTGTSTGTVTIGNNSNTNNTVNIAAGSTNGINLQANTNVTGTLKVTNSSTDPILRLFDSNDAVNPVFSVADEGSVVFQNNTDSDTSYIFKNAAGTTIFNVDSANNRVGTDNVSSAGTNSQVLTVRTGNATGSGSSNSGDIVIRSGNSTNSVSGDVSLEVGSAGTTYGNLNIGSAYRANAINIGQVAANSIQSTVNIATATNGTQTANIGSSSVAANTTTIRGGSTGGINLLGLTNINVNQTTATNINTGTSTGTVTIGNNSNTNNTVNIAAGTTGGINLQAKTTVTGDLIVSNNTATISGTSTGSYKLSVGGTVNASNTGSQYGIQNEVSFTPTGASLSNIWGTSNVPTVAGSALNIGQVVGTQSGIATTAGYTGQIALASGIQVTAPAIAGSQKILDYRGVSISGNADNGSNTSGTITNAQIRIGGNTTAAGVGGTLNNYGTYMTLSSGSSSGTNNYGLFITGNGGGSANSNYAIYSNSTAASLLSGAFTTSGGIINLNASSNYATNINTGTSNAAVSIGNSANTTNLASRTINHGTVGATNTLQGVAQTAANTTGDQLTIKGSAGLGSGNGGTLLLSGGDAGGTGVLGLVNLNPTAFTGTSQNCTVASCSITAATVNANSTALVNNTYAGSTVTLADPTITTAGRVLYVTNSGTQDMTLSVNGGGAGNTIALKMNTTATMFWNGVDWTAAGASSATDLQAAYNNTQSTAGGAEIVLTAAAGNSEGLTIRNNGTTPITGALFEVQSSIAANLFSVNNNTTEYSVNGGAENSTLTNWTGITATASKNLVLANVATGLASVQVAATGNNQGAKNTLSTTLAASTTYVVSFAAKASSAGPFNFNTYYSIDGTANSVNCNNTLPGTGYTLTNNFAVTNVWTKVSCFITTPASGMNASNAIRILETDMGTATFYIDNLSVISNASTTTPANVQIGGGATGGQPTLFTLDQFAGPPMGSGNAAYYGSMYYDTTMGAIQCYQSTGWGACGNAPDDIVTLTPEYSNAVLNGTGVGTMTADFCGNGGGLSVNTGFCASGEARNYYKWTSPQPSAQTYSVYVTYKLPATFKKFVAGTTTLAGLVDDTTNAGVSYSIYRKASGGGLTSCSASKTVVGSGTGSANTWTNATPTTDPSTCTTFVAGDSIVFQITMSAQSAKAAYVENLNFQYSNK